MTAAPAGAAPPREVVILGGGFAGLACARRLAGEDLRVTLIDRTNHHLFQPLLYQVATAGLSPADIAFPIRAIGRDQANLRVLLTEARAIDFERRLVETSDGEVPWDRLVVAVGAKTNFFGSEELERHSLGLKTIPDALAVRRRVLLAFERAELETDQARRRRLLTFVVIGGGPTGVELAGAIAELARSTLARDFRAIDPASARVVLVEAGPRLLPAFPEQLCESARRQLVELGVEVRTATRVEALAEGLVRLEGEALPAATVLWAAGVRAVSLADSLPFERDRTGRLLVAPDCTLPGRADAWCIGDLAAFDDGAGGTLPGIAPVAMQQGRFVADAIRADLRGRPRAERFRYRDEGAMATIGRSRAVAFRGALRLSGFPAWIAWLFVHLVFLMGFRNRLVVFLTWVWSYLTWGRGARLIPERRDATERVSGTVSRNGS